MKIKVCGITREEDIAELSLAGVDYIGFNFIKSSPRYIEIDWVVNIIKKYNLQKKAVPLCEISDLKTVHNKFKDFNLVFYQVYKADDSLNEIEKYNLNFFLPTSATKLKQNIDNDLFIDDKDKYLLDNFDHGLGGSGIKFNWNDLDNIKLENCMIAGGIEIKDLVSLKKMGCWGVDLNSKLEDSPGIKNHELIKKLGDFIKSG
ncbi:MAG: phosphoribosylanthranilate isomerase [Gammaproteobacteria bacterium]|mgnify:FL=1|tara:strand:- start:6891 stop:7499 length:609 start_codon:yes stop_codon:yes gene_type:complete